MDVSPTIIIPMIILSRTTTNDLCIEERHPPMSQLSLPIIRLVDDLPMPQRAHHDDAGVDLYSAETLMVEPGQRALVDTGIALDIPIGYVGLIHPRSGLAVRHGLSIVNAPGTIDAGYHGAIKVCLINLDQQHSVRIHKGDRIAQLLLQRVEMFTFTEVKGFESSDRDTAGFGSSGM